MNDKQKLKEEKTRGGHWKRKEPFLPFLKAQHINVSQLSPSPSDGLIMHGTGCLMQYKEWPNLNTSNSLFVSAIR